MNFFIMVSVVCGHINHHNNIVSLTKISFIKIVLIFWFIHYSIDIKVTLAFTVIGTRSHNHCLFPGRKTSFYQRLSSSILKSQNKAVTATTTFNMVPRITNNNDDIDQSKMPMYITIGPPCSGKTTFLRCNKTTMEASVLHDVAIDDQEGVYLSIPTSYFLTNSNSNNTDNSLNQTMIHDKSLAERIYSSDNDEMRWVLQQLNNNNLNSLEGIPSSVNNEKIQSKWKSLQKLHSGDIDNTTKKTVTNSTWADIYEQIVEEFIISNNETTRIALPDFVDLFVVDAIFKRNDTPTTQKANTNKKIQRRLSGLNAAMSSLKKHAYSQPQHSIAWGNTNTKARDYMSALEIAEQTQRPIYFVVYYNNDECKKIKPSYILPKVSIEELFRRNIRRLLQTGRYIPCGAIIDASIRVETLCRKAEEKLLQQQQSNSSFDERNDSSMLLDFALAQLAGYQLHASNRTVQKLSDSKRKSVFRKKPSRQLQKNTLHNYFKPKKNTGSQLDKKKTPIRNNVKQHPNRFVRQNGRNTQHQHDNKPNAANKEKKDT